MNKKEEAIVNKMIKAIVNSKKKVMVQDVRSSHYTTHVPLEAVLGSISKMVKALEKISDGK